MRTGWAGRAVAIPDSLVLVSSAIEVRIFDRV